MKEDEWKIIGASGMAALLVFDVVYNLLRARFCKERQYTVSGGVFEANRRR